MSNADSDQIAKARRVSEIAERENKATQGPWEVVAADDYYITAEAYPSQVARYVHDNTDKTLAMVGNQTADCGEGNSKFIAHARADIPFLLSALAYERQAVKEDCCRAVCHHCRAKSEKYITRAKLIEGKWIHEEIGFERERGGFDCYAAAIRSME